MQNQIEIRVFIQFSPLNITEFCTRISIMLHGYFTSYIRLSEYFHFWFYSNILEKSNPDSELHYKRLFMAIQVLYTLELSRWFIRYSLPFWDNLLRIQKKIKFSTGILVLTVFYDLQYVSTLLYIINNI